MITFNHNEKNNEGIICMDKLKSIVLLKIVGLNYKFNDIVIFLV